MPRWYPPTKLDALRTTGVTVAAGAGPLILCVCGRSQSADMMVDVRAVPAEIRRHFGGADFVCDACRERERCSGRVMASVLARHLGAPPALVARLLQRELAGNAV